MPSYDIATYGIRWAKSMMSVMWLVEKLMRISQVVYTYRSMAMTFPGQHQVIATDILELAYYLLNMCFHSPKHVVFGRLFLRNLKGPQKSTIGNKTDIYRMLQFTAAGDMRMHFATTKQFSESDLIDHDYVHLT